MLTQERLKQVVVYDPLTGLFLDNRTGQERGHITKQGYRRIKVDNKNYLAHRLAVLFMTGEFPKNDVDHINRERNDNRWSNLRCVTRQENTFNQKRFGVDYYRGKYRCRITLDGVTHYLGLFKTEQKAKDAYFALKDTLHLFKGNQNV